MHVQYHVVKTMVIKASNLTAEYAEYAERQNSAYSASSAVISNHSKTVTIEGMSISVHRKSGSIDIAYDLC